MYLFPLGEQKSMESLSFHAGASQSTPPGVLLRELMRDKAELEFGSQFIELWSEFGSPMLCRYNLITYCISIMANRSILTKWTNKKNLNNYQNSLLHLN